MTAARKAPECPLVIVKDTREPDEAAHDHPDTVFRPRIFAPGIAKGTPYADWPRVEVPVVRETLPEGDYSLPGFAGRVAVERKTLEDLLNTLTGTTKNSVGEVRHNKDRFRAELERVYRGSYAYFGIVVESSVAGLYAEASARFARYGKTFDPPRILEMLDSYEVDFGIPTKWCGTKGAAELRVGYVLSRIWSQATGGEKARGARKRGYAIPWLDALVQPVCPGEVEAKGAA